MLAKTYVRREDKGSAQTIIDEYYCKQWPASGPDSDADLSLAAAPKK
jgi:hypothetical protein